MEQGNRKYGLAALIIGAAVAEGNFEVATIVFGSYMVVNLFSKWISGPSRKSK